MTFVVAAESYDRFMGRYSVQLGPQLATFAGVIAGMRALDVGCGPGALTSVLVDRVGADQVSAVDPSPPFVEAVRARYPGVTVLQASAESLPFPDRAFDAAIAQLVVHFMADPVAGLAEMARVTRPGGVVAASVWDHAGGLGPLGCSGRRPASSIRACATSRTSPAPARVTSPSSFAQPAFRTSRTARSPRTWRCRTSKPGGSRSPAASVRAVPMSRA